MTAERPTLDTVAAAAGVSRMTVSNAYNRPDQLSAATRARVLAVAAELGYGGPDPAGRSLRRGSTGAVGMLLTESLPYAFTDPGLVEFLRGAAEELATAGQAMLLVPADPATGATHVASAIVDGFVVTSLPHDDAAFEAVRSRHLPYVVAGPSRTPGVVSVTLDNVAAARLAAEHLLSLGHRRIGVVGLPPTMPVVPDDRIVNARGGFSDRVTGVRRACEAAGLPSDAVVIEQAVTNSTAAGAAAAALLLARHPRPTAVFAVSDVLALGALAACSAAGLSIPRDVSVVGFDDIDEAQRSTPPLTTVHHGLDEQGRQAARSVLALIAGGRPRSWRASPHLVVRESTGPAPRRAK